MKKRFIILEYKRLDRADDRCKKKYIVLVIGVALVCMVLLINILN